MEISDHDLEFIRQTATLMQSTASFAGMDHIERVRQLAEALGAQEGADLGIVRAAAYLHDIGVPLNKMRHYELGARMARGMLRELGWDEETVQAVSHAIEGHSRYGGPDPQTLEAKVLYDADVAEFVGAIGLARAITRATEAGEYRGDVSQVPALIDRVIASAEGASYTARGGEIIAERIAWLRGYQARLQDELASKV